MHFVQKSSLSKKIPISLNDQNILKNPYKYPLDQRKELAHRLLQLKETYWISCDCTNQNPIIVICNRNNGEIYLRRRTKADHSLNCIFNQSDIEIYTPSSTFFIPSQKMKTFCMYYDTQKLGSRGSNEITHQSSHQNVSRLGQLLYTVICESGINTIKFNAPKSLKNINFQDQCNAIYQAFKQKNIAKNIPLDLFFHYTLTEKSLKFAESKLLNPSKIINSPWPSHIKPFILFLSRSAVITSHTFSTNYMGSIEVISPLQTTSPWINKDKSAPYLILSSLILNEKSKPIFKDAFAIPILSENELIPVESSFERTVLKIILGVINSSPSKLCIEVEKPLFCLMEI